MGSLESKQRSTDVNVTLAPSEKGLGVLGGKEFPCPLCGAALSILNSKRNKPYCTCNDCGLQIFIRGKRGISRLKWMAENGILISLREESAARGIFLLNRLERLKLQKRELEEKQGILSRDENVENAISLVDAEIESAQGELAKLSRAKREEKKT